MKRAIVVNYTNSYEQRAQLVREDLEKNGCETTVFMSDILHREKRRRTDQKDGFHFVRTLMYKKNISPARLLSLWDFSRRALGYMKKEAPDLLYVFVPANSSAHFAKKYKKAHGDCTLVFDVNDLWPETLPVPSRFKNLFPLRIWRNLRDRALGAADVVIGECDLFSDRLKSRAPECFPATVLMPSAQRMLPESDAARDEDALTLGYLGSVNNIIDIDAIASLVREACKARPVRVEIVGTGERMGEFTKALESAGARVTCHGLIFGEEEKQKIFDHCDFGINMMRESVVVGLSLKSVDYLRMRLPVVNNLPGDIARFLEDFGAGINVGSDPAESARRILSVTREENDAMRERAAKLFSEKFTPEVFFRDLDGVLGLPNAEKPPVTVLLAAYNGEKFLPEQLDSLLRQDYPNLTVVLSDDASSDSSAKILDEYAEKYPDRFVRHRAGVRFGNAQKHFMHLLRAYRDAGYVMFCDQDDFWLPDKVSQTMAAMQRAEAGRRDLPVLVHTDLEVVDGNLSPIAPSFIGYSALDGNRKMLREFLVQNVVTGCTTMLNAPLCRIVLSRDTPDEMLMHDWWIALCAAAFGRVAFLPRATIRYRQHGGNSVGAKNVRNPIYILHRIKGGGIRLTMNETMRQAGAFANCFEKELSPQDLSLCRDYAACETRGRFSRAAAFLRLKTFKNGLPQKVIQLLLG